ncbi:MAG: hypothetical protein ACRC6R_07205 [Bacteroidales bacterium]
MADLMLVPVIVGIFAGVINTLFSPDEHTKDCFLQGFVAGVIGYYVLFGIVSCN